MKCFKAIHTIINRLVIREVSDRSSLRRTFSRCFHFSLFDHPGVFNGNTTYSSIDVDVETEMTVTKDSEHVDELLSLDCITDSNDSEAIAKLLLTAVDLELEDRLNHCTCSNTCFLTLSSSKNAWLCWARKAYLD